MSIIPDTTVNYMRTIVATLIIIWSLVLTGCPTQSLSKAQDASKKVATYADAGVNLTRELYRSNFLTLAQKDLIADKFILLAKAGVAFDAAVANAIQQYGTNAPKSEISKIFAVFDSTVVAGLLDILSTLKLIPAGGNYAAIIETIRTAVLVIAGVFGQRSQVAARLPA